MIKRVKTLVKSAYERVMAVRYARRGTPRTFAGRTLRWRYAYSRFDNYEPPMYEAFVERLIPGMTVFDIGSWIGLYAVTAAAAGCDVYAFEPSPTTRGILASHLTLNRVKATIVPAAMSDRSGKETLYTQRASGWESLSESAASRVQVASGDGRLEPVTVATVTFDAFCAHSGVTPDLVKLDVEGAEMNVLAGAQAFLQRREGTLLIEAHPSALAHFGHSIDELLGMLTGWETTLIYQRGSDDNPDRTLHFLVTPS